MHYYSSAYEPSLGPPLIFCAPHFNFMELKWGGGQKKSEAPKKWPPTFNLLPTPLWPDNATFVVELTHVIIYGRHIKPKVIFILSGLLSNIYASVILICMSSRSAYSFFIIRLMSGCFSSLI